jgi:hypothetical protein
MTALTTQIFYLFACLLVLSLHSSLHTDNFCLSARFPVRFNKKTTYFFERNEDETLSICNNSMRQEQFIVSKRKIRNICLNEIKPNSENKTIIVVGVGSFVAAAAAAGDIRSFA